MNKSELDLFLRFVHDLKSPLTSIMGSSELLRMNNEDDLQGNYRRLVDRIFDNSKELLRKIELMLTLSRLKAGKLKLDIQPFSPFEILENIQYDYKYNNLNSDASIAIEGEKAIIIRSDPHLFKDLSDVLIRRILKIRSVEKVLIKLQKGDNLKTIQLLFQLRFKESDEDLPLLRDNWNSDEDLDYLLSQELTKPLKGDIKDTGETALCSFTVSFPLEISKS